MKKLLNNIVALLFMLILPLNLTGLTIYYHSCNESGKKSIDFFENKGCNFKTAKSGEKEKDCCIMAKPCSDNCELNNRNNIKEHELNQLPCCTGEADHLKIDELLPVQNQEPAKSLIPIRIMEIIPYSFLIARESNILPKNQIRNSEINPNYNIIRIIHHSSSTKSEIPNEA